MKPEEKKPGQGHNQNPNQPGQTHKTGQEQHKPGQNKPGQGR